MNQAGSSGSRFAPLILILLLAAPVAAFAYAGTFSRYMADDYCTASSLQSMGLLKSQIDSYTQWSGRFAFTLSVSLAEAIGPSLPRLLPALAVLGLTASLVLAITSGVRWVGTRLPARYVICIALLITFLTLEGTPNIYQSLYWQTGMLTYIAPLVITGTYAAWLFGGRNADEGSLIAGKILPPVGISLAFIAGGFSEMYSVVQVVGLAALVSYFSRNTWLRTRRPTLIRLVQVLAAAVASLVIVAVAPGNQIRRSQYPSPPDLAYIARHTVLDVGHFLQETLANNLLATLLTMVAGLYIGFQIGRGMSNIGPDAHLANLSPLKLLFIPAVGLMLITTTMVVSLYAIASYPPDRALIIGQFIFAAAIVSVSTGFGLHGTTRLRVPSGERLQKWALVSAVAVISLAGFAAFQSVRNTVEFSQLAREFSMTWDQRDRFLRDIVANGDRVVRARSLTSMGTLAELDFDQTFWVNQCVASYYGLEQISAK